MGATTLDGLVAAGRAIAVPAVTDTGYSKYGVGRLFLPAATNVIPDVQGTLANGTFWPASTAHTAVTAGVAPPIPLPAELTGLTTCLSLVNDGTADAPQTANLTVTAAKDYFDSLYIYAPTVGGNLTITAETGHTFTLAAVTAVVPGWTRYSIYAPTVAGETTLSLKFAFAGGTASTVYIVAAQAVQESVESPFFCGLLAGCAWTGTANASTSTRTVSTLKLGNILSSITGAVAFRFVPLWGGSNTANCYLFGTDLSAGGDGMNILASTTLGARMYDAGHTSGVAANGFTLSTKIPDAGSINSFVLRYLNGASGTMDCLLNGANNTQKAHTMAPDTLTASFIGTRRTASNVGTACAYIGPLVSVGSITNPARPTDAETVTLEAMLHAGASGLDLFNFISRYKGSIVCPLVDSSKGYRVPE
jgi:hypothetical protein